LEVRAAAPAADGTSPRAALDQATTSRVMPDSTVIVWPFARHPEVQKPSASGQPLLLMRGETRQRFARLRLEPMNPILAAVRRG